MSESIIPEIGRVSAVDYAANLLMCDAIDESRRPYVYAQIAIHQTDRASTLPAEALVRLEVGTREGTLVPPLSPALLNEIDAFLDAKKGSMSGPVAKALLAMALDEGMRPVNTQEEEPYDPVMGTLESELALHGIKGANKPHEWGKG